MPKSDLEKAIEKQTREVQNAERKARIREQASAIVSRATHYGNYIVMDREGELFLQIVLDISKQFGSDTFPIGYDAFPETLQNTFALQLEKMQLYGMLAVNYKWMQGCNITLFDAGKEYFNKKDSIGDMEKIIANQNSRKKYDVFISHASADKLEYVDDLYSQLRKLGVDVFYDTDVINWGDNWKTSILNGTEDSEFAIIVISNNFFDREWTERELQEFLDRQNSNGQKIILPLLYGITVKELCEHYPELVEIQCISTEKYSLESITILFAKELIKRYKN